LVVYTDGAAQAKGGDAGIKAFAGSAVGNVQTALSNSGINASARLAGTAKWSHTSTGDLSSDINKLRGDAAILALRTQNKADLVAALVEDAPGNTAGIGAMGSLSGNKNACWSVIKVGAVGAPNRSFAHEIGHNLGAGHSDSAGAESSAKGLRFTGSDGKDYRTQMAYAPGTRIPWYSNPSKSYQGKPTGTASANNAATITKVSSKVAGYE
jgi:hypothetical protein